MDFGMTKKPAPVQQQSEFDSSKLYVWVKGLESKLNNLLREVDIMKNDFIKRSNQMNKNLKAMNDEVLEMRHEQEKTIQKMGLIIKELKQTAGIEEVMTMKKYIEFWNPLNFVTQNDLERAIESKVEMMKKAKKAKK